MKDSAIEWTDHTFNPWIGCTKVSPGCAHCYAETLMDTRYGRVRWGKGQPRQRTSAANWKQPVRWDRRAAAAISHARDQCSMALGDPANHLPRPRVFCASLADWLDDEVPLEWLADLLDLIRRTPHLDWLLLTKRPQNWLSRVTDAALDLPEGHETRRMIADWFAHHPPANLWIGTSVEDQQRADVRIPHLLRIPARVRFLSCEPLLGEVDLNLSSAVMAGGYNCLRPYRPHGCTSPEQPRVHWVIVGGESGPTARPMMPTWANGIKTQCEGARVAFFMKQMGGTRKPFPEIPVELNVRQFPEVANV